MRHALYNYWCLKSQWKRFIGVWKVILTDAKGDIDRREAEVNITFHTPINLDIGLFIHQLLFYSFSVSSVVLILSKLPCQ